MSVSITCSSSTLKDLNKTLEAINEQLQAEVSEHEKTEKELLDSKEAAEAAVRAKAAFLANMSHELRTLMNSIIGFTSPCLGSLCRPSIKDWFETMRINGDALLTIINDILNFSIYHGMSSFCT
ncbi:MAG: histidine kinase dimerization/phospho-acceptor domain-containing protein [Methanotrichaceae archaeon]